MKVEKGGITAPRGFWASGIHCGIKYKNKDLALVYSEVAAIAAGVFTRNRVQAAPVKVTIAQLKGGQAQAIIVNSGNANCCTGSKGIDDARKICSGVAQKLGINHSQVLVASTGIIGKRLPIAKINKATAHLIDGLSRQGGLAAAQAIMTTDSKSKQVAVKIKIGPTQVTIGGMAKGAGMISPDMATMLAFISMDAVISKQRLNQALKCAVDNSFNLLTVEGDMSTNDMVLALANGLAGNKTISRIDFEVFQKALNLVCLTLAKMIVKDAEGATKLVEVLVEGAKSLIQAKKVAFKVANSPLVKTAIFGEQPNWGRIAAAVGSADMNIKEKKLNIYLGGTKVLGNGVGTKQNQNKLNRIFKKDEIQIRITLGLGKFNTRAYTCDLTDKYIRINAKY
ncbi:MAG: bifunctional glutamate N-acetyltransferase/amino-acid acetyltransferase ArgJ [Candidatus Omnitrophica bacterium]|nr:bifunctional glutamate N-acetyltransferase/amino-acid acetyltransferase ArgJ [Candidatus Omnitrophota bacterium]